MAVVLTAMAIAFLAWSAYSERDTSRSAGSSAELEQFLEGLLAGASL